MQFYSSPSFFLALTALALPAVVLGLTGRPIKRYGEAASFIMLALLFSASPVQLGCFAVFVVVAVAGTFATLASWRSGRCSLAVFRVSLASVLAPLVLYKLTAAAGAGVAGFIGISYVTFRAVQVLIEIRDGLITELTLGDYLYFLTFFAQITSGPIDRSRRFLADANGTPGRRAYADLLTRGILLLLAGAVLELVLATMVKGFFDPASVPTGTPSLTALPVSGAAREVVRAYAYGIYLFWDFAGYSYMAMGASYLFGIRCPTNFRAPWRACDLKDFWNRWHITLSTWLRDFVFMRFTRAAMRHRWFSSRLATACAGYLVNMVLMGAWHGLTVDFLAYGLYHGVLLAATEVYQKRSAFYKRHRRERWYRLLSWAVTLQLVIFGFVLFSGQLTQIVGGIING